MRGYAHDVPEDHAYLGEVLADPDLTARAAAKRKRPGAVPGGPPAKRAGGARG